jgi:3-phenylpropionate/cinnamic acid dioxygenase small subunit
MSAMTSVPDPGVAVRLAAAELLARYADLVDAGDFDGVGELLAACVVEAPDGTPIATGREEVAALFASTTRRHADGTPRTAHLVTNVVVVATGDPDEVEVRSRFCVLQATDALPLQPVVAGRYVDRLRRDPDGWAFVRRRMLPELWGDTSEHLAPRLGPPSS